MLTNHAKLIIVVGLLSALLLGIWIGIGLKTMTLQAENHSQQQPSRLIMVAIDKSQWNDLFDSLRKFSDKWGYAIRVAPLDPNGDSFIVDMWRADIRVTAFMDNISDPGIVQIAFYDTDRMSPVPEAHFDEEISNLKSFLSEIPNVTISDEK